MEWFFVSLGCSLYEDLFIIGLGISGTRASREFVGHELMIHDDDFDENGLEELRSLSCDG